MTKEELDKEVLKRLPLFPPMVKDKKTGKKRTMNEQELEKLIEGVRKHVRKEKNWQKETLL